MDEKKGQGRPQRKVKYIQLHDAFIPLNLGAAQTSLTTAGPKAVEAMEDRGIEVFVRVKGREFFIPKANISFGEYNED